MHIYEMGYNTHTNIKVRARTGAIDRNTTRPLDCETLNERYFRHI